MAPVVSTPVSSSALPAGQYKVVSIALDLTGKKLIDEICHIGAYYQPDKVFSQYVMPFREVSLSSIQAHGVRICTTFGKFRVLKDAMTMRTLKTKSEYSALCDFLAWLKETKGHSDGILLAYHDNNREAVTSFLLEALNRYKIADDFFKLVPGFVNVEKLAEEISEEPDSELKGKPLTLRALSKQLLTNDQQDQGKGPNNKALSMQSAKNRANYTYMVLQKLTKSDTEVAASDQIINLCSNRADVLKNLAKQQLVSEKIRTLKPLFAGQLRKSAKDRTRAVALRRYLIDAEIDYQMLQKAYEDGSGSGSEESVTVVISKTSASQKEKDMHDLVEIIMSHFKDSGENEQNNNKTGKEVGQGDPTIVTTIAARTESGTSASSTESDEEEFEEAHDEVAEK